MDTTLAYSLLAGIVLVLLFVAARVALRWMVRLAIIGLLLAVLGSAAWLWFKSPRPLESKPRSTPTRRASSDRQ